MLNKTNMPVKFALKWLAVCKKLKLIKACKIIIMKKTVFVGKSNNNDWQINATVKNVILQTCVYVWPSMYVFGIPVLKSPKALHDALDRGLPQPLLSIIEHFDIDKGGLRFGRASFLAGHFAHILLWYLNFCICTVFTPRSYINLSQFFMLYYVSCFIYVKFNDDIV